MVDVIVKLCIAAAVILAAVLLGLLIFKIKRLIETYLLLTNGERNEKLVYKVLAANYSRSCLLRNAVYPFNLSPDAKLFRLDAININHGGVLLITVRNMRGTIENPFHGDWRQFFTQTIKQLRNPLELNAAYAQAVNLLLKQVDIQNVPVSSVVVYLDPKTKFKNRIEQILLVDRLTTYIHDMNNNHFLSNREINKTANALRELARKPQKSTSPPQYRSNYPDRRPQ